MLESASPEVPPGEAVGQVVAFFAHPSVAIVQLTRGTLKVGDTLWIKGHTTDLKETVESMEMDHQVVTEIKKGQEAGIKVSSKVRRNDRVYKIDA